MIIIPSFDPDAVCVKCGCTDVAVRTITTKTFSPLPDSRYGVREPDPWPTRFAFETEVLPRRCERCGHAWDEAPLDAAKGQVHHTHVHTVEAVPRNPAPTAAP